MDAFAARAFGKIEGMKFIGCDPGLKGAIVHYDNVTKEMKVLNNDFDGQKFATVDFFNAVYSLPYSDVAVLENVKINGGWSAKSNATLQRGVGTLGSLLNQRAEFVRLVSPTTWKSQLFLTSDKQLSMDVAHLRFPNHKHLIIRHDIAEACLLIAWHIYGDETVEVEDD